MRPYPMLLVAKVLLLPLSAMLARCRALLLIPPHHRGSHRQIMLGPPKLGPAILALFSTPVIIELDDANYVDEDDLDEDDVECIAGMLEERPQELSASSPANQILGNRSTTSSDYIQQLDNELGRAFVLKLLELEDYRQENGNCLVPKRYHRNPSLGNWVNKQRQNYRKFLKGEKSSMNETRISALNERGFVWDATSLPFKSSHSDNVWKKMYNQLAQYYSTNGHCRVPSSCQLGQWVVRQRYLYRRFPSVEATSSLTDERIRLLNKIDFQWMTRSEGTWDRRIGELREFKRRNGHVMVPRAYPPNPQLSSWVATQRKNYNRRQAGKPSPLTIGRIRELDELDFVWCFWDYNFMAASERGVLHQRTLEGVESH